MPIPAIPVEVALINVDYIKKFTNVNGSVDDNILKPCIILAQDKWVSPYLGDDLMAKIKSDVSAGTISGNYLTLYQNYIMRALCWWSLVEAIPSLMYKIDNGTIVQRISEDTQPISDEVSKDMINKIQGNAKYYTKRLVEYLCENSSLFPEYSSNTSPKRCPRTDVYGQFNYGISSGNSAMGSTGYKKRISQIP